MLARLGTRFLQGACAGLLALLSVRAIPNQVRNPHPNVPATIELEQDGVEDGLPDACPGSWHNHRSARSFRGWNDTGEPYSAFAVWDDFFYRVDTAGVFNCGHGFTDEFRPAVPRYRLMGPGWPVAARARVTEAFAAYSAVTSDRPELVTGIEFRPSTRGHNIAVQWTDLRPDAAFCGGTWNFGMQTLQFDSTRDDGTPFNWSFQQAVPAAGNEAQDHLWHFLSVALHEIGHVAGLFHQGDADLMDPSAGVPRDPTEDLDPGPAVLPAAPAGCRPPAAFFPALDADTVEGIRDLYSIPVVDAADQDARIEFDSWSLNGTRVPPGRYKVGRSTIVDAFYGQSVQGVRGHLARLRERSILRVHYVSGPHESIRWHVVCPEEGVVKTPRPEKRSQTCTLDGKPVERSTRFETLRSVPRIFDVETEWVLKKPVEYTKRINWFHIGEVTDEQVLFDLTLPAKGLLELKSCAHLELLDDKEANPYDDSDCGPTLELEVVDAPPELADVGVADGTLVLPPGRDNDGDSLEDFPVVDEDPIDGADNDGDGKIDEDPPDLIAGEALEVVLDQVVVNLGPAEAVPVVVTTTVEAVGKGACEPRHWADEQKQELGREEDQVLFVPVSFGCASAGQVCEYRVVSRVRAADSAIVDPDPSNDQGTTTVKFLCGEPDEEAGRPAPYGAKPSRSKRPVRSSLPGAAPSMR